MENEIKYSVPYTNPEKVLERADRVLGIIEDQLYLLSQMFQSTVIIPDSETASQPAEKK